MVGSSRDSDEEESILNPKDIQDLSYASQNSSVLYIYIYTIY